MIKRCELWNIASVHGDWEGRKILVVVYVAKVLRWFKVHYILAMVGEPQVAMRVTSQIWQVVFASQTLLVFCFSLRKKAQYVVVFTSYWFNNLIKFLAIACHVVSFASNNPTIICWNCHFSFKKLNTNAKTSRAPFDIQIKTSYCRITLFQFR